MTVRAALGCSTDAAMLSVMLEPFLDALARNLVNSCGSLGMLFRVNLPLATKRAADEQELLTPRSS